MYPLGRKRQLVCLGALIALSAIIGCNSVSQNANDPALTTASLSTTAFNFGNNLVNNALTQTVVTVTNTGSSTLTMIPSIGGDPSYSVSSGTTCGRQLAPSASCNVVVNYAPATASAPATQNATLNLGFENAPTDTPQTVAITGTSAALPAGLVTATDNPQVALYTITLPFPGSVIINFGTDTHYGLQTWTQPTQAPGGTLSIFVAGMRATTTYHMQAAVKFTNGINTSDVDHTFTTKAVPSNMKLNVTTTTTPGMTPQSGVELLNPIVGNPSGIIVTDLAGNTLWTYTDPGNQVLNIINGIKMLANGNLLMTIGPVGVPFPGQVPPAFIDELREVNLAGDTVREITIQDLNSELANATCAECHVTLSSFHHDVEPLPNGHWLALCNTQMALSSTTTPALANMPPTTVLGDVIVDLDQNMQPVWVWNEFNHLDPNRHPLLFPDWTHTNALLYSKDDGHIIVSVRNQNWILKINYENGTGDGKILWHLGEGGDLALQNGVDPTDWQYAQHGPTIFSANTSGIFSLGVMDNGNDRIFPAGVTCGSSGAPACLYTTVPVFQINEGAKTATLTFHQILPATLYSNFAGNAEQLANGNLEYDLANTNAVPFTSDVFEVTQQNAPQTVWTMHVSGTYLYRALRIPSLYPGVQW